METSACRPGMMLLLFSLAFQAGAAESGPAAPENVFQAVQLRAAASEPKSQPGNGMKNQLSFVTGEKAQQLARQMKERLADPQQRAALRAEQRASIQQQHFQAGRVLGLDPATLSQLIERLTDQQMNHLDQMYEGSNPAFDSYREAQATTRRLDALRELLGDEGLDRYQDYVATLGERRQVGLVSERLDAGDKLRPDQEERLIALLHEQTLKSIETVWMPGRLLRDFKGRGMPSRDAMLRESELSTIAGNEASWRSREVTNREIERQAAEFLTSVQLTALSNYQAQEQEKLRQWVESARAHAGMDAKIPEYPAPPPDVPAASRQVVDGQVRIDIRLTVNRGEPTVVTQTLRNGASLTFGAGEGLVVEATPTLYDDHWLYVQMNYYEQGTAGKRRLNGGGSFGVQTRLPDGSLNRGGGGSVVTGRKGYAIDVMIDATAL